MKTSRLIFATAAAVPFLTLIGLSGIAAFTIATALSIVAMLALDFDHSHRSDLKATVSANTPQVAARQSAIEAHPLAA